MREITRETFEQFKDKLRHEGERLGLQRLYARRLGRSLSADEETTLVQRLDTVGPDRLGDVVLDLSPDALAAWLRDPDAR